MRLSWRDLVTTILAIMVAVVLFAKLRGYDWAFIGSWKGAVGTIGVLGGLMAIFSEADFLRINAWGAIEGLLAIAGIGLLVAGLLVASKLLFILLGATVIAMFVVSVSRHMLSHEPNLPHPTPTSMSL